jgi:hypothetical protein
MCNTQNDANAQYCKSCGYIFEDFSNTGTMTNPTPHQLEQPSNDFSPSVENSSQTPPTTSTDFPLFVVSRPILTSLTPGILYIIIISFFASATGFGLYSLGVIAIFILLGTLPVLFGPRKYEFYNDSLRIKKMVGGQSEIPYSNLEIHDYQEGRRPRIILSETDERRAITIPGNPTNNELGEDLNQFLHKKLKKYIPRSAGQQSSPSDTQSTKAEDATRQP